MSKRTSATKNPLTAAPLDIDSAHPKTLAASAALRSDFDEPFRSRERSTGLAIGPQFRVDCGS
jgi:hypothetical protein